MNTLWYRCDLVQKYRDMKHNTLKPQNNPICIDQSHLTHGTYRITTPGFYMLKEDIVFHPNPENDFKPTEQQFEDGIYSRQANRLGFFAAITIECPNVILDLNGYTLSQSLLHNSKQRFFALIELANTPFIPNTGPANFGKDILTASNTIIKNGTLGLSSHHGIHGNNNKDILIHDVVFKDFEVAAISLNAPKYLYINDCHVKGNNTRIMSNAMLSQSIFDLPFLNTVRENNPDAFLQTKHGKISIHEIYNKVQQEIDLFFNALASNSSDPYHGVFGNPSGLLDGNCYGIVLNSRGPVIGSFKDFSPTNDTNCSVVIENTLIENITSSGLEIAGYGTNENTTNGSYGKDQLVGPLGDIIQFHEALDEEGFYAGHLVTDMQLIINKYTKTKKEKGSSNVPLKMIQELELGNQSMHEILKDQGYYIIPNRDSMGHHMKGNAGLFISQGFRVMLKDMTIKDIHNNGLGSSPSCETSGVLLSGTNHISMINTTIQNIVSKKGEAKLVRYKEKNNNIIIDK